MLPYRHGTQSAVLPQSLVQGVPVLATQVGGIGEVVADGVSGVVVDPRSAAALRDALSDQAERDLRSLSDGARKAGKRMSWSSYAKHLVALAERVVGPD